MILRSVIKHVRNQEWSAIAIDFVIVVVGVFIGIQVSNWNQGLADRRIAENYIARLQDDLRTEIQHYGHLSNYLEVTRKHAIAALDAYRRPADELGVDFLIDLYQASQQWNLTVRRGTYDELLASGRIGLISDESMRSMINNYYESSASRKIIMEHNTFVPYRKTIRTFMDDRIQRLIREKCDDVYTFIENNFYYLKLPETCDIEVPGEVMQASIKELLANSEVHEELRFQQSSQDTMLGSIKNGMATAEAALIELENTTQ